MPCWRLGAAQRRHALPSEGHADCQAPSVCPLLRAGTTVEVSITVSPIVAPDGSVVGVSEVRRRESGTGRRTPAIALTAFARPEDRTRSLRAGFQSHMAEPVNVDELVALLDSLVQR